MDCIWVFPPLYASGTNGGGRLYMFSAFAGHGVGAGISGHARADRRTDCGQPTNSAGRDLVLSLSALLGGNSRLSLGGTAEASDGGYRRIGNLHGISGERRASAYSAGWMRGGGARRSCTVRRTQRDLECAREPRFHGPAVSDKRGVLVLGVCAQGSRARIRTLFLTRGDETSWSQF